ncbi:MAG: SRPBCC family protein [Candidatus Limnocylindria bacterium]
MNLEVSESIDRPPADVFRFVATDHVKNHPRWDPEMSLVQLTPGPIGVGTRIHRTRTRGESRIEGEMEITDYDPDRSMRGVIRDGPIELRSLMTVTPEAEAASRLTFTVESDDAPLAMMEEAIKGSLRRIKEMLEGEGNGRRGERP